MVVMNIIIINIIIIMRIKSIRLDTGEQDNQ